jgi:hypothetical protein
MTKKMMLLALGVAAVFAIPSAASSQEIHINPSSNFSISGTGRFLAGQNEPTLSCTNTAGSGSYNAGSTTTGSITLDFTGCTFEFFGLKGNCNTAGAPSGTIASSGTFHLITISSGKPGMLVTTTTTTFICAGFTSLELTGDVIGTITSPACGVSSKTVTVSYVSTGTVPPVQEHRLYTGVEHFLRTRTDGSATEVAAGLSGTITLESAFAGTIECT